MQQGRPVANWMWGGAGFSSLPCSSDMYLLSSNVDGSLNKMELSFSVLLVEVCRTPFNSDFILISKIFSVDGSHICIQSK